MTMEESPHKSRSGLVRIARAFGYSMQGFGSALRHEHAFRQELMLCAVLLPVALWLPVSVTEHVLLIGCLFIVLITELLNSAIEAVVDRVSLEDHALSKRAKDIGSAAVFLALVLAGITWVCIAGPVVWAMVQR
jgi:diacylglycerol kinase (ATP)